MTLAKILIASGNEGKVREIRSLLGDLEVGWICLGDLAAVSPCPEDGETYEENATSKALHHSERVPFLTLADDSGLEVDCLGGAPAVRSARFGGEQAGSAEKCRRLLSLMEGVPARRRGATFRCVVALARQGRVIRVFRGSCRGRITPHPTGVGGFGFDPVFHYPPAGKTFAELEPAEKAMVSHRGRALRSARSFLEGKGRTLLQ